MSVQVDYLNPQPVETLRHDFLECHAVAGARKDPRGGGAELDVDLVAHLRRKLCWAHPYGLDDPEKGFWSIYLSGVGTRYGMRPALYGSFGL